jgi:hypothetical protein
MLRLIPQIRKRQTQEPDGHPLSGSWLGDGEAIAIQNAPTVFGTQFGVRLVHDQTNQALSITISQSPGNVRFVFPCRFGTQVESATADGNPANVSGIDVNLPANTQIATVTYR